MKMIDEEDDAEAISSLFRVSRRSLGRLVASEQHSGGRGGLDVFGDTGYGVSMAI
jgi:hypothetical protein